jgi:hypothetical protein
MQMRQSEDTSTSDIQVVNQGVMSADKIKQNPFMPQHPPVIEN